MVNRIVKAISETANSTESDRTEHLKLLRRFASLDGRGSSYRVASSKAAAVVAFLAAAGLVAGTDFTAEAPSQCPYMTVVKLGRTKNSGEFDADVAAIWPYVKRAYGTSCTQVLNAIAGRAGETVEGASIDFSPSIPGPAQIYQHIEELAAKNPDPELAKKLADIIAKAKAADYATPPLWVMELAARPFIEDEIPENPVCWPDWQLLANYNSSACLRYLRDGERSCNLTALASAPAKIMMMAPAFSTYLSDTLSRIEAYGLADKRAIIGIVSANLNVIGTGAAKTAAVACNPRRFWTYVEAVLRTATGLDGLNVTNSSRIGMVNQISNGNAVMIAAFYANPSDAPSQTLVDCMPRRDLVPRLASDDDAYAGRAITADDWSKIAYAATHLELPPHAEDFEKMPAAEAELKHIKELRALTASPEDCRGTSPAFFHPRPPSGIAADHTALSRFFADLIVSLRKTVKSSLKAVETATPDARNRAPAPNIVSAVYSWTLSPADLPVCGLAWTSLDNAVHGNNAVAGLESILDAASSRQLDSNGRATFSGMMMVVETNIDAKSLAEVSSNELDVLHSMFVSAAVNCLVCGAADELHPSRYDVQVDIQDRIGRAFGYLRSRISSESGFRYGDTTKLTCIVEALRSTLVSSGASATPPVCVRYCRSDSGRLCIAFNLRADATAAFLRTYCSSSGLPMLVEGEDELDDNNIVTVESYDGWSEARKVLLAAVDKPPDYREGALGRTLYGEVGDMNFPYMSMRSLPELTADRIRNTSFSLDETVTA